MKALRDEFYFEPRVIDSSGKLRWYGEVYTGNMLLLHTEETVYIRDNGSKLFIYTLDSDQMKQEQRIEAVFTLVCQIQKYSNKWRYGKSEPLRGSRPFLMQPPAYSQCGSQALINAEWERRNSMQMSAKSYQRRRYHNSAYAPPGNRNPSGGPSGCDSG
ncbi:MAG: hypothetical protein ACLSAC_05295 [Enterocloster bolteae]